MSVSPATLPRMSVEQYLEYEATQDTRHELVDGYLYAMTGASERHERIAMNLLSGLLPALKNSECRVYKSDMKVAIGPDYFYPDLFVACGAARDDSYARVDPIVIIEILSPTTQRFDRGDKRLAYETIETLQHYVLVSQDSQRVEVRQPGGSAPSVLEQSGQTLELPRIGLSMTLADIYA